MISTKLSRARQLSGPRAGRAARPRWAPPPLPHPPHALSGRTYFEDILKKLLVPVWHPFLGLAACTALVVLLALDGRTYFENALATLPGTLLGRPLDAGPLIAGALQLPATSWQ